MSRQFKHISLGGTFDFLHIGHREFLKHAFDISDFVFVGIVSDKFAQALGKDTFHNYIERERVVDKFLLSMVGRDRFKLLKLDDIFGNTLQEPRVEGLIVTKETLQTAVKVNEKRQSLNLPHLKLIIFEDVKVGGVKTSSSLIRQGVLNQDGISFEKFLTSHDFFLPILLRSTLVTPYGRILKKLPRTLTFKTITVGDQTTFDFVKSGLHPFVSIIDFKIQRTKVFSRLEDFNFLRSSDIVKVQNPSSVISHSLSKSILCAYKSKASSVIVVDGEEDLATIPGVLLAPIPSAVYYGIREVGLVEINLDLDVKNNFWKILNKFTKRKH